MIKIENEKKEKFTTANVFMDSDDYDDYDVLDEGYFRDNGFYSLIKNKTCNCMNRIQHEAHLQEVIHNVGSEDAECE